MRMFCFANYKNDFNTCTEAYVRVNFVELDIVDQHGLPALSCFTELFCLVLLKNERV